MLYMSIKWITYFSAEYNVDLFRQTLNVIRQNMFSELILNTHTKQQILLKFMLSELDISV